ncbi:putative hydrolase of the HAD superfamily [Thermosyntropha lipolytica DSM 11003]|uniref:Putative hydrolase of the HAD superfamily n=1 Tax=Thermosyntropha lipolytica DSM 11003 TaxID=1123382 RepID=A0A1M5KFF5_9FIRM|nr:HAD family hydrolase [Thermosyntropha lipolytica]SHG51576.1 putative hydrolase of the HAD superfamily [Thermosyntropha lipolytica DSM 11003]
MFKAVTFDFWNTLYKPPAVKEAGRQRINLFHNYLLSLGINVERREVKEGFLKAWDVAHKKQREEGLDITPKGHLHIILEHLKIKLTPEEEKKAYTIYTETLLDYPPVLNDDVKEVLPLLKARYKLAVICNTGITPGKNLRQLMKKDAILDFFDFLVFSDEVGFAKPSDRIFNFTLKNLGVENKQAAHVGDDILTDMWGAKNAGMTTVWLAPEGEEKFSYVDYHILRLGELTTILGV